MASEWACLTLLSRSDAALKSSLRRSAAARKSSCRLLPASLSAWTLAVGSMTGPPPLSTPSPGLGFLVTGPAFDRGGLVDSGVCHLLGGVLGILRRCLPRAAHRGSRGFLGDAGAAFRRLPTALCGLVGPAYG